MTVQHHSKRDNLLRRVTKVINERGLEAVNPARLFSRASTDDLAGFKADQLAALARVAKDDIAAWLTLGDKNAPSLIAVTPLEGLGEANQNATVLGITGQNKPFLYDSIMAEVAANHRDILLAIHPILNADDGDKVFLNTTQRELSAGKWPAPQISHIQIVLAHATPETASRLKDRLEYVLSQVRIAISDWKTMLSVVDAVIADMKSSPAPGRITERAEAIAFVEWLRDNNFTFLGMRSYDYALRDGAPTVTRDAESGLGILSDPDLRVLRRGKSAATTTPEILAFLESTDELIVTKANTKSVIHRRAYMDYIGLKRYDSVGQVTGELRIVGLFTSTAYTKSVLSIPLLRSKAAAVMAKHGHDPESHSGKALLNTLESYPRDELFQINTDLLSDFSEQIADISERPRVRVLPRVDRFDRFVSVIVYAPRDQYDTAARERIGAYLANVYAGHVSVFYPSFPEGGTARVHFIIGRREGKTPVIAQHDLELAIRDIVTRWEDKFAALSNGTLTLNASEAYRERYAPEEVFADQRLFLQCSIRHPMMVSLYRGPHEQPHNVSLKIFHSNTPLPLSRRVPILENIGFQVISEQTYDLEVARAGEQVRKVVLHDMELADSGGVPIDLAKRGEALETAFLSTWNGVTDDDGFNRLVLSAGLSAREASVLRAYARYLRQAGLPYSQDYIAETLARYPAIAADLFSLFVARFDPDLADEQRNRNQKKHVKAIREALGSVPNLDDDRIIRRLMNAIRSTLRTNYFQRDDTGNPRATYAFKLDPRALDSLPEPRPFREIFVYGADVEGVHLRFGPIARGGLRWSDRAQDYRTEVLGLVKAQQIKNAVIVPVGAKGGFYPKSLPATGNRDQVFAAGREAYKTFIRTLLSVTDNLSAEGVVPPQDTVRHDGDDPYFVVAADKGTATFSDTANSISQDLHFWLDDAFASGGSAGYDHKKMGITARGAWEAVKRHFREMNRDIQTEPFTVVGVGDMSGDVFGNGMLLSPAIRLVAAFDHRDIFIDPDPDPATGFAERQRVFNLNRSSWQDYDTSKLSKGGMIISRHEKTVRLTPQAASALDLEGKHDLSPFDILKAILKADVDLMWFGGIGTYIRGNTETNAEVGDRANDPIRVTASQVRAKVIGEGANLGVTQHGRIDYGLAGGRCNSDAIDNSAGVNSSDIEVNIKIALASAMRDDRLTREKRDKLLTRMTNDVADLVLRNNYLQTLAISLTERLKAANQDELAGLLDDLELAGHLDRQVELLPDDPALAERYAAGHPLTRPEIGVLLSYAKMVLFSEIAESKLPDDPYLHRACLPIFRARCKNPSPKISATTG